MYIVVLSKCCYTRSCNTLALLFKANNDVLTFVLIPLVLLIDTCLKDFVIVNLDTDISRAAKNILLVAGFRVLDINFNTYEYLIQRKRVPFLLN